jgi:hypothetical protein
MESKNPLEIASIVGRSLGGNIGELALIELELAYATRLLPKFNDDPNIRVCQNVLLYWQRGLLQVYIAKSVFSDNTAEPENLKPIFNESGKDLWLYR